MRFTPAVLLPVLAAAAPSGTLTPEFGSNVPDPALITIQGVSWSGSGCPQGTVSTKITTDKTAVTFGFDEFQTYIGPGTNIKDRTKNCQLHISLKYPGGFQFAVLESTYHGYALLEKGVTGSFFSTYYFSEDAGATTTTQVKIEGGGVWQAGQVYTKQDQIPTASIIWSPCGQTGNLNINNRIGLTSTNSSASGIITDDDATIALTQQVNFQWRECK